MFSRQNELFAQTFCFGTLAPVRLSLPICLGRGIFSVKTLFSHAFLRLRSVFTAAALQSVHRLSVLVGDSGDRFSLHRIHDSPGDERGLSSLSGLCHRGQHQKGTCATNCTANLWRSPVAVVYAEVQHHRGKSMLPTYP